jgi:uncharacterized tellurite resistance protein B-like protein
MLLPGEVLTLVEAQNCARPDVAVRTLGDINGSVGEAYVVAAPPQLLVASRRLGSEWQLTVYPLTEVTDCRVEGEGMELRLAWSVPERDYDLPIPSHAEQSAQRMCGLWLRARQREGKDLKKRPAADKKAAETPTEITPVLALSAALQAMLMADNMAADEEWRLVERLIERPATIEQGAALFRKLGVDGLLARLGEGLLDEPQKQCLLANLYELAMVDGRLRASEVTLLDKFRETLGVDRERCAVLEQVLRTKNDLSVFSY